MTGSTGSRTSTIFKKCKSPIDVIRALCLSLVTNNKHGRSFFYAVNKQKASQQNDLLRCVILTRSLSCHIRPHCLIVSYLNVFFFFLWIFFLIFSKHLTSLSLQTSWDWQFLWGGSKVVSSFYHKTKGCLVFAVLLMWLFFLDKCCLWKMD